MLRYFQFLFFNYCSSKSTHIARGELSLRTRCGIFNFRFSIYVSKINSYCER
ncbi:hypothetical protein F383_36624 [Gossypium arboreum]|uniref:Uncharacterized protein n=1 Tax=Gossypium arboreum TaxID=29729 RepID=A0A0B0MAI3_GOSAR|nr:hypothetical protein F383_36624 [Gossypium arboreum]